MPDPVIMQHFQVSWKPDGSLWELGRGAMGVTYKAKDMELGGTVALKVINSNYLHDATARERFLREARAAAYLHHPNIASVFHLGREGDSYFYAMEFVEGETLQSVVAREGALLPRLALRLVLQAAQGLSAASERGLIHRDIKPANLMLTRHEGGGDLDDDDLLVKVIDFGLAKSVAPDDGPGMSLTGGGPIGTPYYMSPEQIEPGVGAVDGRSDIYSLGVTLWCLLTGKPPFQGSQFQIFSQHLHQPPPLEQLAPLGLPPGVGALLGRMLAKNPADRPANHRELVGELKALLRAMPATAAGGDGDPDSTLVLHQANGGSSSGGGTLPAQPPAQATAGFPLVEVLRARGTLPAADVLRLLQVLAPEVDAAGCEGPIDLRPAAVMLRFSPPPDNLDALPALAVTRWPPFAFVLRTNEVTVAALPGTIANVSAEETLLPGSHRADGTNDVARLAALISEMLGGQPTAAMAREDLARPLPALGEAANGVLARALRADGGGRTAFASAAAFAAAFAAAAKTDGTLAHGEVTVAGRSTDATLPPPVDLIVPAVDPSKGTRGKIPVGILAACILIPVALFAGWWLAQTKNAVPPVAPKVVSSTPSATPVATPATPTPQPSAAASPVVAAMPAAPAAPSPAPTATNPPMDSPVAVVSATPVAAPGVSPPASAAAEEEQEEKMLAAQEALTKAARTLRVPKQYPAIQAAIDAAQSGDTVLISPGKYHESLRFKEGIRLLGSDEDTVVVTAPGEANALAIIDCSFGKIADITFRQTPPPPGVDAQPAIFFKNSGVQLTHCRVSNSAGIGMYLRGKDHSTVSDCEVIGAGSDGIHIMDAGASPTIVRNRVEGGKSHGILLHMHGNGKIINNVSEKNAGSGIIMMGEDVKPVLQGNKFLNNRKWGIQITRPAAPDIATDNVSRGNEMGATHEETMPAPAPMPSMPGM